MSGMRQLVYEVVCMGGSTDITSEMKVWHSDVHKVQTVIIASSLLPSSSNTFNASSIKRLCEKTPLSGALPVAFKIRIQLFSDSTISNIFAPSLTLSGAIVCLAPENTRSGPADIGGILKIVIAIRVRLG